MKRNTKDQILFWVMPILIVFFIHGTWYAALVVGMRYGSEWGLLIGMCGALVLATISEYALYKKYKTTK